MKKLTTIIVFSLAITGIKAQSTIPTTTVNGSLRVTDSLQVTNTIRSTGDINTSGNVSASLAQYDSLRVTNFIHSYGDISTSGNMNATAIIATGEVTATDTMRAKKDVLVDGNAVIGGELRVAGVSTLGEININDKLNFINSNIDIKPIISGNSITPSVLSIGVNALMPSSGCSTNPPSNSLLINGVRFASAYNQNFQMYNDGTSGYIDYPKGISADQEANPYSIKIANCLANVDICSNNNGGVVSLGPNVEIGMPIRNKQVGLNMLVKNTLSDAVNIKSQFTATALDIFSIGSRGGVKVTTTDAGSIYSGFVTPYAFSVFNRNKNREVMKVANLGTINLYTDNTTPDGAVVISNVDLNKTVFKIFSDGKTQIGISVPKVGGQAASAMLSVDGLVLAKEVKIAIANTHWADYVFNNDYNLMPLNEVEAFIINNKHLPEVPSTKEVEMNGINVVEMQANLLKKIEELTLYLLQENKRIEKLEKENAELKKQLLKK